MGKNKISHAAHKIASFQLGLRMGWGFIYGRNHLPQKLAGDGRYVSALTQSLKEEGQMPDIPLRLWHEKPLEP